MAEEKERSVVATVFSILAIAGGLNALLMGLTLGARAGWEKMAIYVLPVILFALVAIAIRRNGWTYAALVGALLGIVGLLLGS